jgi:hypothetical protein
VLVTLSASAKISIESGAPHVKIDCGVKLKAEGTSANGGYIFQPSQLLIAGVPKVYVHHLKVPAVTRHSDGKVFYDVCHIRPQFVISYG